ncbi:ribonuclease HII [Helcococcus kunzii]|uniref:ribonuclease HII n=1 Tax=Helcococcus kunzii TaxID=40091 RepID=UPI001C9724D6|nr:ribonuclease HII [Helcococcus kunzii]QZO77225.1 ribonuclease HII [Helcococcus kunzii]
MRIKLNRDQLEILLDKAKDYNSICGVDEVGRGPIAGPVVSCAIVMGGDHIDGVKDSKKLTDKKRRELAKDIYSRAIAIGYGIVEHNIIDEINIRQASLLAMKQAIDNLSDKKCNPYKCDLALIDAEIIEHDIDQIAIISGDDLVYEISCASILAKIFRDDIMIEYSKKYPEYMFEAHKGYGTKKHYEAIDEYGLTDIHRKTFMKKYYEQRNKSNR